MYLGLLSGTRFSEHIIPTPTSQPLHLLVSRPEIPFHVFEPYSSSRLILSCPSPPALLWSLGCGITPPFGFCGQLWVSYDSFPIEISFYKSVDLSRLCPLVNRLIFISEYPESGTMLGVLGLTYYSYLNKWCVKEVILKSLYRYHAWCSLDFTHIGGISSIITSLAEVSFKGDYSNRIIVGCL